MFTPFALLLAFVATLAAAETHGITPHDMYSSSVGVLGCKINTNRLLRIDQSGGAYDISYDAYNYLVSGQGATEHPITGGAVNMQVENISADNCVQHLKAGGLALSASNSINYVASCLGQPNSWVARNHRLFNIQDPVCHWGHDEQCTLDLAVSNQPSCPHGLGTTSGRLPDTVFNIQYGTGAVVAAP
ncbi:hypothetical protein C8A00DRAFT_43327 [Chaetomidium leptoderma]|uniref:Uncharacterized protein n=1 Tax=Chaetomidium leptoderma TaxID=669021 RepID=A0AAN6VP49_9PEZI|nr:hypothetical protein C8A00DRAFT_43327 [Chaetomidium leptoderma]